MTRRKWWILAAAVLFGAAVILITAMAAGREEKLPGGTLVKNETEESRTVTESLQEVTGCE